MYSVCTHAFLTKSTHFNFLQIMCTMNRLSLFEAWLKPVFQVYVVTSKIMIFVCSVTNCALVLQRHSNASQSLCEIVRLSRDQMLQIQNSSEPDPLLATLEKYVGLMCRLLGMGNITDITSEIIWMYCLCQEEHWSSEVCQFFSPNCQIHYAKKSQKEKKNN